LTQQKQSLSLFKTGKKQNPIWSSRVITTKKVTKEVLEVSGLTKVLWRKHHKDIISTVTDSDELYILALLRLRQS
jgi:hypothetical protein